MNDNLTDLWEQLKNKFSLQYGQETGNQLLGKTRPLNMDNDALQIIVINQLIKNMILMRATQIETILKEITGKNLHLAVDALEKNINTENSNTDTFQPVNNEITFDTHLDPKFRFENFVVGNNTRFAHSAALNVSENPGKTYNPLFIYGKPGLGKTHLIQAIGNHLLEKNPYMKIFYTTTEEFVNDVVNAIHNHTTEQLHNKYRKLDCLIIDDIQLLKGKEATQEEFFNTFNALDNAHKQIIIASDRPPQEIKTLEERITSRLSRGLLGDISEPDYETRLAILRMKLDERNMNISTECMNLIAASITNDIRLLESVCNNLKLYTDMNEVITQDLVMKIIEKHGSIIKHEGITFEEVLTEIVNYYGITKEDLIGPKRSAKINQPRQILMYLARKLTGLTFNEIGKELGGRDHSTIMNGYEKIYTAINNKDKDILMAVNIFIKKLER